jgi:hypothetical protein
MPLRPRGAGSFAQRAIAAAAIAIDVEAVKK